MLNHSPILTRTPLLFERAYYTYQVHIQRALHNPFPHDFYFKLGSLLESKFNLEQCKRDRKAFGSGFGADHPLAPVAGVTAQNLKKFRRDEDEMPTPRLHASNPRSGPFIDDNSLVLHERLQKLLYVWTCLILFTLMQVAKPCC